jgi:uncharacterized membrane protein YfcA
MLVSAVAIAAGAVAQAVTGLGFSLVSAPFLIAALGSTEGVRLNLVLSAALNLALLARERTGTHRSGVASLLIPATLATPFLAWVVHRSDDRLLAVIAGALTIASAAVLAHGVRVHKARGFAGAATAGVLSAAMNLIGGIGGPPIAMYAVNADWPTTTIRPTIQAYSLGLNAIGIIALGLPRWAPEAWLGLAAGWILGLLFARRVPESVARPAILLVAAAGGLTAIVRALT